MRLYCFLSWIEDVVIVTSLVVVLLLLTTSSSSSQTGRAANTVVNAWSSPLLQQQQPTTPTKKASSSSWGIQRTAAPRTVMISSSIRSSSSCSGTRNKKNQMMSRSMMIGRYSHFSKYNDARMSSSMLLFAVADSSSSSSNAEEDDTKSNNRNKSNQNKNNNNNNTNPNSSIRRQFVLYNSRTRQKELFVKQNPDALEVSMYTCGPTVYDYAHIGNFRAFLTYDLLKRVLIYLGYTVRHVCNITDVDDKIIQRANQQGIAIGQIHTLTERYETEFLIDLHDKLNCIPATVYPRATQHIDDIIQMIRELATIGLAYETKDGSWYFDTRKQMGRYGQQLVNLNFNDMMEQKEFIENIDGKKHFADFCLWKAYKPGIDREDSSWEDDADDDNIHEDTTATTDKNRKNKIKIQKGRPGWHIECSAMARHYFGDTTLDFHGGGQDLKFPHHENEIAQSEGVYNANKYYRSSNTNNNNRHILAPMDDMNDDDNNNNNEEDNYVKYCNCWFHNGFVNLKNDEKMSKSLNNFVTLRQATTNVLEARAYRYLVLSSHYRNPLTYTPDVIQASKNTIIRIDKIRTAMENALLKEKDNNNNNNNQRQQPKESELATVIVPQSLNNFEIAITDDLMMPRAAASMFNIIKAAENELKRYGTNENHAFDFVGIQAALDALNRMDQIFGIFYDIPSMQQDTTSHHGSSTNNNNGSESIQQVPETVRDLVAQRLAAKEAKDWELADSLRNRITELGYTIKDVKNGEPIINRL